MRHLVSIFAAASMIALGSAAASAAEKGSSGRQEQAKKTAEIPVCTQKLGTIAIVEPDNKWWRELSLGSPEAIIKIFVQKSGCFGLVNRGAAAQSSAMERALAEQGDLQRGSNVGRGQVKAADYFLQPDIVSSNKNSGGNALGGAIGGLLGGRALGALVGGINVRKSEANVTLSIVNARTTEEEALTEGYARKSDLSFAAGGGVFGGGAFGGVGGGGYQNTDIGQVIVLAYLDAYTKLVEQLGGLSGDASGDAPIRSFEVQTATAMRKGAGADTGIVRALPVGMTLYPTGNKDGLWWEVIDENDNVGWVSNDNLAPKQ